MTKKNMMMMKIKYVNGKDDDSEEEGDDNEEKDSI